MFSEFCDAWNEYLRIDATFGNTSREFLKGRDAVQAIKRLFVPGTPQGGKFKAAGYHFAYTFNRLAREQAHSIEYVWPCLRALTFFVKFLKLEKGERFTFKGFDDSFVNDIYNNRNFKFKQQWTKVLRSMAVWVRLVYPDEKRWSEYLLDYKTVNWADILQRLKVAEAEVLVGPVSVKTKRGRGMFDRYAKAELDEPHPLDRMRALLCEI